MNKIFTLPILLSEKLYLSRLLPNVGQYAATTDDERDDLEFNVDPKMSLPYLTLP